MESRRLIFREEKHKNSLVDGRWFTDDYTLFGALHFSLLILLATLLMQAGVPRGPLWGFAAGPTVLPIFVVLAYHHPRLRWRRAEIKALVRDWCWVDSKIEPTDVVCDGLPADVVQVLPGFDPDPPETARVWIPYWCRAIMGLIVVIWGFFSFFNSIGHVATLQLFAAALALAVVWQTLRVKECRVQGDGVLEIRQGWRLPGLLSRRRRIDLSQVAIHISFPHACLILHRQDGSVERVSLADFPHRHGFIKAVLTAANVAPREGGDAKQSFTQDRPT